jgi:hypothetical protein
VSAATPTKRIAVRSALLAAALFLLGASAAGAADSIYWTNFGPAGGVSFASLAGGGGGNLDVTGANGGEANGLAIDTAAGRVYWISAADEQIYYASLTGGGTGKLNRTGASAGFPIGLAIDPVAGRVYWANSDANKISYAKLDGSGGGDLDTTGATVAAPTGVAVEDGMIYWTNESGPSRVSFARLLPGSGGGDLNTAGSTSTEANGLSIDLAGGRVYWADYEGGKISYAALNGSGGGDLGISGAALDHPWGLAIDPLAGRIYWADEKINMFASAPLAGGTGAFLDVTGATVDKPAFPVLLKAPSPRAAGVARSGAPKPGAFLSCLEATWEPDRPGAFLFQAPQTVATQWLKDGQPIAGETGPRLTATAVGSYSCQSTATNFAGSATQTSIAIPVFSLGRVKQNRKKGTATLAVQVPGPGSVTVSGETVKKSTKAAGVAGTVKLAIKAKGKAKKKLGKRGKVKVSAIVSFALTGGSAGGYAKTLTLRKKLNG